jgi:hypothetical protein
MAFGFDWWQITNYWFTCSYNKLTLNIKTCVSGGGADINNVSKHCIYETNTIDLFNVDLKGNLQLLEKQWFKNIQYNETDILNAQSKIKAIADEYNKTLELMPYEFRSVTNCERLTR